MLGRCFPSSLWIFLALAAGCASPPPFITVSPEPKNHAWWLRSEIRAFGSHVRGIPAYEIAKDWCKATEFTVDLFPPEIRSSGDFPLEEALKRTGAAFSFSGKFGSHDLDVLVGVYEACTGQRGTFLLAIQHLSTAKRQIVDVVSSTGSSNFPVLRRADNDKVEMWWCFECGNVSTFKWNDAARRFELEPEPQEEESMAPNSRLLPDALGLPLHAATHRAAKSGR